MMYYCSNIRSYCIEERKILLYFRAWIPEHPRGVLIFIHGTEEHSGMYCHIGTESFNRQIAFIAPDLRGFGQSGGQKGHIHRFQDYLDDLDQLVIQFQKQYPQMPIFLFGHSLGALIVIRYVQHFTDKVAGVILSSPALGICLRLFKRTRKYLELASLLTPNLPLELVKWNEALRRVKRLNSILPDWTAELLRDPLCTVRFTPQWFTELLHNGAKALSVDAKLIEQFMETISSVDIAARFL